MPSAGLTYGVLCIGVAGLASLMGGILQVEQLWRIENVLEFYWSDQQSCTNLQLSTMFLFTGSRQYIWGHWRSFAWSVYDWYPLSVC